MTKYWPKLKIYLSIGSFILVNFLIFQNFESSFGVKKTNTDISQALNQAEKDAQGTAYRLDLSSEAPKKSKTSIKSEPVKITLKRAPQIAKKKKKSYFSIKNSKKTSPKVAKVKSKKSHLKSQRKISGFKSIKNKKSKKTQPTQKK